MYISFVYFVAQTVLFITNCNGVEFLDRKSILRNILNILQRIFRFEYENKSKLFHEYYYLVCRITICTKLSKQNYHVSQL